MLIWKILIVINSLFNAVILFSLIADMGGTSKNQVLDNDFWLEKHDDEPKEKRKAVHAKEEVKRSKPVKSIKVKSVKTSKKEGKKSKETVSSKAKKESRRALLAVHPTEKRGPGRPRKVHNVPSKKAVARVTSRSLRKKVNNPSKV